MERTPSPQGSPKANDERITHFPLIPLKPVPSPTIVEISDSSSNISQITVDGRVGDQTRTRTSSKARSSLGSSLKRLWRCELVASTFSLLAFVALIVVLKHYDHRPQKEWSYNHLTLNGLVALLSTICRAALLVPVAAALSQGKWIWYSRSKTGKPLKDLKVFDDASRGALGSLQLLWTTKGMHLVSFGALLTILTMAFDTLSQQLLSVEFHTVIDTGATASIPRSEMYENHITGPNSTITLADLPMQAAVLTGWMTTNITDLPVYCPTGHCTWPIIPSLGMCGSCTDVTSNLTHNCNSTHCTYSLPSGSSITGPVSLSSSSSGQIFRVMGGDNTVYKPNYFGYPLYVLDLEAIGVPYKTPGALNPNASHVSATECALWYCVQAYNVSVTHGRQSQRTIGTWSKAGADMKFIDIPPEFNVAPNISFGVSEAAYEGLILAILDLAAFGALSSVSLVGGKISYTHSTIVSVWLGSQDWNSFINRIALSMSNTMRLTAPADDSAPRHYAGTAYTSAPFVRVRWLWLTFPALMVLASTLLLAVSIWQTGRSRVSGWKGNPLALLFADVDEDLVWKADGAMDLADFQAVQDERVLLERGSFGRWHFRRP